MELICAPSEPWNDIRKLQKLLIISISVFFFFVIADVLSYLNVLACTINQQPWECVYQRSGRLFDIIDDALVEKVNELKGKKKEVKNENI